MKEKQIISLRKFSEDIQYSYQAQGLDYPVHLSGNNEDALIEIFKDYNQGDWIFSTHRSHYHWVLSGRDPVILKEKILSGNSMHVFDDKFFTSAIVGGVFPIAVGVALALKLKGSTNKVFCFSGDMAFGCGIATESIRYAHNFDLPIIFVNEDNGKSVDANTEEVWGKVKHYKYDRIYPHATGLFRKIVDSDYHKDITEEMTWLGEQNDTIFLGQNVVNGNYCGTLKGVSLDKRIEMPVTEELQMGMSTGLSLEGFVPISCYPRMDFLPRAMDQIINHLNLIEDLSKGLFKPKVIIRTSVGLENAGLQHSKDLKPEYFDLCNFPVAYYGEGFYKRAYNKHYSVMVIERQVLYG